MLSTDESSFLVINIAHANDFMQLTGDARGVQLDFPMINARQRSFEKMIREVTSGEGLEVEETFGSDGALFLDISIQGDARHAAAVCSRFLREVFNVPGDAELIFQHVGLADGRAT